MTVQIIRTIRQAVLHITGKGPGRQLHIAVPVAAVFLTLLAHADRVHIVIRADTPDDRLLGFIVCLQDPLIGLQPFPVRFRNYMSRDGFFEIVELPDTARLTRKKGLLQVLILRCHGWIIRTPDGIAHSRIQPESSTFAGDLHLLDGSCSSLLRRFRLVLDGVDQLLEWGIHSGTVREEALCAHLDAQIIVQTVPPLMGQRTGATHFGQVDDLPQRLIVGDSAAAAAGAEGNGEDTAVGDVLFADFQSRTEVF